MERKVKVQLLGQYFEVQAHLLEKIPYIANMWQGCESREDDIDIPRSAHLFKHVLAYVIDDTYPFPAKYEQELKFYGLEYKPNTLYNPEKQLTDLITHSHNDLMNMSLVLEKHINQLNAYNGRLDEILLQICHLQPTPFSCIRCGHNNDYKASRSSICELCEKYCAVKACKTKTETQYCTAHSSNGIYCNRKGCIWRKMKNSFFCMEHEIPGLIRITLT